MSDDCPTCKRRMPLTDAESRRLQEREFWEFAVTGVLGKVLQDEAMGGVRPTDEGPTP